MAVNLAEGLALSEFMSKFKGAALEADATSVDLEVLEVLEDE